MEQSAAPQENIPNPTPPPVMPPVVTVTKRKTNIPLLIIISLLLVAIYGAYAYYMDMWPFGPDEEITLSASPSTTPDATANWKTYTNTQYGFQLDLPPTWKNYIVQSSRDVDPSYTEVISIAYGDVPIYSDQAIFAINVYTSAQWGAELALDKPHPIELARNDRYVFTTPFRYEYLGYPGEADIDEILSTFRFTDKSTAWIDFSSKYFTLSFSLPETLTVQEGQNYIWIAGPQPSPGAYGATYNFFELMRYTGSITKSTEIERAQATLKNIVQDSMVIDGTSFTRITGNPFRTVNGSDEIFTEKIEYVFFDKSYVTIIGGNTELVGYPDPIALGNQILSTFRFSK